MKTLDLSQYTFRALAIASGLHESAISRLMTGKRTDPNYSTLVKLQEGLKKLTRKTFPLEDIAAAIRERAA